MKSKNTNLSRRQPSSRLAVPDLPRFDAPPYGANWTWWDADTKLAYRLHIAALFDRAGRHPLPALRKAQRLAGWLQAQVAGLCQLPGGRDDYFNDPGSDLVNNCIHALQRSLEARIAHLEAAGAASQCNPQKQKGTHAK